MTHAELCIAFQPELKPGMTWRELVWRYVPEATEYEADWLWIHVCNGLFRVPFASETTLAQWCQFRDNPLADLRRLRAQEWKKENP